jgi:hypothetical protein
MEYQRIKRKVIKAGVELRVEDTDGSGFNHVKYFSNALEAKVYAERYHAGKEYRIQNVRVDATPIVVESGRK